MDGDGMSFVARLFGGGAKPQAGPPPPAPRIGDAAGESAVRESRYRLRRRRGVDDTSTLGTVGSTGQVSRSTLGGA
jgi:hypothetical protein